MRLFSGSNSDTLIYSPPKRKEGLLTVFILFPSVGLCKMRFLFKQ